MIWLLWGAAIGALAAGTSSAFLQLATTGSIDLSQLIVDVALGGVLGAFGGSSLSKLGVTTSSAGAGFTASVVEDWVQGESINLVNAVVSALFCAVFALNRTTGSQYKTKSTTLGIKGTIKGISKRTGTWTKGLKQIYTNKLNTISGQMVSQIKSGFNIKA